MTKEDLWDAHAYVFTYRKGNPWPYFERTFPASCISRAFQWLGERGRVGFVSINCLPERYWR